jgi:hypothetical protein
MFCGPASVQAQWLATGGSLGGSVVALAADSQFVYAGTTQGRVWRRPISDLVTGVSEWTTAVRETPAASLVNYPNPCNASTVFRFSLQEASRATLRLYDMLGRNVTTVLDLPLAAGAHQWSADLSALPTGVYLAVFSAGEIRVVHRVLLIR